MKYLTLIIALCIIPSLVLGADQKAQGHIDHDRNNIASLGREESHLEADKASQIGHARFGAATVTQNKIDGIETKKATLRADLATSLANCPTCR